MEVFPIQHAGKGGMPNPVRQIIPLSAKLFDHGIGQRQGNPSGVVDHDQGLGSESSGGQDYDYDPVVDGNGQLYKSQYDR